MNLTRSLSIITVCACTLFFSCEKEPGNNAGAGNLPTEPEPYENLIGTYYVENREMTLKLYDITYLYQKVVFAPYTVPVSHTEFDNLPKELKETVKNRALGADTQVYRMKWNGETVYQLICLVYDDDTGVFKESGERIYFNTLQEYSDFRMSVTDIECLILIKTIVKKDPSGATDLLTGTWMTDWEHLHHDIVMNSGIDDQVALYDNLPFSITEVCKFNKDGSGYLRTVKTYKSGRQTASLDPFKYYITDYHGSSSGSYKGFYYLCQFEAGDVIEYSARSYNNFTASFDRAFTFVTYPWYKKKSDPLSKVNGEPKFFNPGTDKENPVVGRWSCCEYDAYQSFGKNEFTFVFRPDSTGYLLDGRVFVESFAYTLDDIEGQKYITLYKYDNGFYINDGFWQKGDASYSFVKQPVPGGKTYKTKIYDNGDSMELQGWTVITADQQAKPVVFKRVD